MLKHDSEYPLSAKLELRLDKDSAAAAEKALTGVLRSNDRVSVSVKTESGNLYIQIEAKDTNILRAVIMNYINTINTLEEIDKL
jgi:tRNA threonylcarbamoyladenosine modification (KEOPS) complex  Pcc1 subunit